MRCNWFSFLNILPLWMRDIVDQQGKGNLLELRLRLGYPPEMIMIHGSLQLQRIVTQDDLLFSINTASKYSPWAAATIGRGYVTASGGHRVGICGIATVTTDGMVGIRTPTSVCIRVARDFSGIASKLDSCIGSILIIGKPGSGKTTLLRDLIRRKSNAGNYICVVDEKAELFPFHDSGFCFPPGDKTDIMTGCSKSSGLDAVLRNMGPSVIAVDEITAAEDCQALLHCAWCGVTLYATAHASNFDDLLSRDIYQPLISKNIFQTIIIVHPDKSWHMERINK